MIPTTLTNAAANDTTTAPVRIDDYRSASRMLGSALSSLASCRDWEVPNEARIVEQCIVRLASVRPQRPSPQEQEHAANLLKTAPVRIAVARDRLALAKRNGTIAEEKLWLMHQAGQVDLTAWTR